MSPETETKTAEVRRSEAGFSLVELMVVVFIMGLLATLIIVNVAPVGDRSRVTKAQADISNLENALEQYSLDLYSYPSTDQGLAALSSPPAGVDATLYRPGGYIRRVQEDPWGNPYQYTFPGTRSGGRFDVFSFGADGQPGGEGNDADIGNWD
ncbi:general secretion pathway protein G [Hyphomonas neptunium ATCC 15444]|uniref:Type II secretion system core protein G n=2 Tax=Hyphomonas TaxID=85 RepID=Q0C124_HYPNA|nr:MULTISPECIES: type II secretion system major pseudopilin GspG [Hyphomonas]ABI77341.1 general secretion pathway protein G [Hyphomonas neptunium ATCC 15444]KCZ95016.1 general secretion pathway protein G [Hyphomonas hirschiana VP5]